MSKFFLNLFTPETWEEFRKNGASISGFRERQSAMAQRVKPGDILLCYLVRLSRWCGVLEIMSPAFNDDNPIYANPDPYVIRFKVKPLVALEAEKSIPIYDDAVWNGLKETKAHSKGTPAWTGHFRSSLREMADDDGKFLLGLLQEQLVAQTPHPYTDKDKRQLARKQFVPTPSGNVIVEVPDEDEPEPSAIPQEAELSSAVAGVDAEVRKSIEIQAKIAHIGAQMGFKVWVPPNDRAKVLELIPPALRIAFLDNLALNYENTTLDTIRQIDVLWLNQNAMTRAFEIEHTTAIYSGLLRMADLFALQPNMKIKAHIVAPEERRKKVLKEIVRPVFWMLSSGPLYESCTLLSYDSVDAIAAMPHLEDIRHTILYKYAESADED